jgi:hypothetical protein
MTQTDSSSAVNNPRRIVPLPYALYDSNGLIFELYDGGQPRKQHEISWVKREPMLSSDGGDGNESLLR